MIADLNAASETLKTALENYLHVCSCIPKSLESQAHILEGWASKELPSVASYEATLQQARAIISQVRNTSTRLAPVNILPDEVLSRIFHLVLGPQLCNLKDRPTRISKIFANRYPEYLSYVCTHWRRVAIGLCSLWSHIDIVTCHKLSPKLYARGEAFASRRPNLPITLHINDYNSPTTYTHPELSALCTSISTQIQDLRIRRHHCQSLVLRACLAYCTPGRIKSLYLEDECRLYECRHLTNPFIDLPPEQHQSQNWWLDLPGGFVEELLLPVQKLHLQGCLFHWNSGAYSGLTELLLRSGPITPRITLVELVKLLSASPQLRILRLGVFLSDLPQGRLPLVHLPHLEVLDLRWLECNFYPAIFQVLSPGTEPLQLLLQYLDAPTPPIIPDLFRRSNITRLYVGGPDEGDLRLSDILDILPKLRTLIITEFSLLGEDLLNEDRQPDTLPEIEDMRMVSCSIGQREARAMIKRYSIQKMVFWCCSFELENGQWDFHSHTRGTTPSENEIRRGYFADTGISVQFIDSLPKHRSDDEWEDWNPWGSWP